MVISPALDLCRLLRSADADLRAPSAALASLAADALSAVSGPSCGERPRSSLTLLASLRGAHGKDPRSGAGRADAAIGPKSVTQPSPFGRVTPESHSREARAKALASSEVTGRAQGWYPPPRARRTWPSDPSPCCSHPSRPTLAAALSRGEAKALASSEVTGQAQGWYPPPRARRRGDRIQVRAAAIRKWNPGLGHGL